MSVRKCDWCHKKYHVYGQDAGTYLEHYCSEKCEEEVEKAIEKVEQNFNAKKKLNNIITLALAGMKKTTLLFLMARHSGVYKERKAYQMTDLEMKKALDGAQADVAAHYGKIIIAEHVMKQQAANQKQFRKAFKGMTIEDVYNDLCIELADQITQEEMGKYGGKQDNGRDLEDKDNGQHSSNQVAEAGKKGQQEA